MALRMAIMFLVAGLWVYFLLGRGLLAQDFFSVGSWVVQFHYSGSRYWYKISLIPGTKNDQE